MCTQYDPQPGSVCGADTSYAHFDASSTLYVYSSKITESIHSNPQIQSIDNDIDNSTWSRTQTHSHTRIKYPSHPGWPAEPSLTSPCPLLCGRAGGCLFIVGAKVTNEYYSTNKERPTFTRKAQQRVCAQQSSSRRIGRGRPPSPPPSSLRRAWRRQRAQWTPRV